MLPSPLTTRSSFGHLKTPVVDVPTPSSKITVVFFLSPTTPRRNPSHLLSPSRKGNSLNQVPPLTQMLILPPQNLQKGHFARVRNDLSHRVQ
ncbi:hypothetical protein CTA1_949 [Colletotrichum tanaceti]|uniref:Uncharacterized protein n=1 Tax=Colletotrichum tanaceti TaxID=1306861 RepID=A0A4U6XT61_9PEZI|nr:hypothetical protein CTA1_949 [Colletotrichum tanaceti]